MIIILLQVQEVSGDESSDEEERNQLWIARANSSKIPQPGESSSSSSQAGSSSGPSDSPAVIMEVLLEMRDT